MRKGFDFGVVDGMFGRYPGNELSTIAVLQDAKWTGT